MSILCSSGCATNNILSPDSIPVIVPVTDTRSPIPKPPNDVLT